MHKEEIQIIRKIASIEKRIKRFRGNNRLLYYKPSKKQEAFHASEKRNRWVFGGNRSGKTECGAVEAVYLARGVHPYRQNKDDISGWVVSLSSQVQRDVAQKKILNYINPDWIVDVVMLSGTKSNPKGGVIDYITIKNVFGGTSRIGFKSCEAGRDKFQGASLDFVWFDEEPPEDIYLECCMRVLDRKGDIFGTMTPLLGLTFIYNRIYMNTASDPSVWHTTMEWADNPHLDTAEIEKVTRALSETELLSRRYGKFSTSRGLVYHEFDESVHTVEPFSVPIEWLDKIAIDPGLNNPLACLWFAVSYDGVVYVIDEHYQAGKDISYHAEKIISVSDKLGWPKARGGKIEALIDSAANQITLSGQKSVADLFLEKGIAVSTSVDKAVFSGIARVKKYLNGDGNGPKLYIFNHCENLIRELKGYFWGTGDMPQKKDDHALDALRYYLSSSPQLKEPKKEKSEISLDMERLLRRKRWKR